jgi:hypothetical protein
MLATIAIFFVISLIASVLVIAATMLSSRLSHREEHYLAEEYEVEQDGAEAQAGKNSPSSL